MKKINLGFAILLQTILHVVQECHLMDWMVLTF